MAANRIILVCVGLAVAATFTVVQARPQQEARSRSDSELVRRTALLEVKVKAIASRLDAITKQQAITAVAANLSQDATIHADLSTRLRHVENRLDDIEAKLQGVAPSRLELDCKNAELNLNGPDGRPFPLAYGFLSACIADIRKAVGSLE